MKPLFFNAIGFLCFLLVANACKKNTENTPETNCKLTQYTSTSTTRDYTSTYTSTYDYNDKGLMSGQSGVAVDKDKAGVEIANSSATRSYQYDADGHLVKEIGQSQGISKADGQSNESTTADNQYQSGRLTKRTYASSQTAKGKTNTRNGISTYEYDKEGNNTKFIYVDIYGGTSYSSTTLYEWKDKKLTKITKIDEVGNQTVPFIEVNSNGWITKYISENKRETRYTYDSEGNQLRIEYWYQGKKNSAQVYEYDTQKAWSALSNPSLKVFPENEFYGNSSLRNTTKVTSYSVDNTGQEKLTTTNLYNYQYNGAGYPTSITITNNNGVISTVGNTALIYKDCQ